MDTFTFTIETAPRLHEKVGATPSEFLDRLSDAADELELPRLRALAMTVDQDSGALTLIFETDAEDFRGALKEAFADIGRLMGRAAGGDITFGATITAENDDPPVERIEVSRSDDREPAVA